MTKLYSEIIVFWAVINTIGVQGGKEAKKCSTTILSSSVCPPNARCSQIQTESEDGFCKCIEQDKYVFNGDYKSDTDYCIFDANGGADRKNNTIAIDGNKTDPLETMATAETGTNGLHGEHNGSHNGSPDDKEHEILVVRPLPGAHHVIGGILIPIFFVLIAVGVIYVVKNLHIRQRVRNIRMTRRNRPFYEDVMLGNNDNDDPPLI